MEIEHVKKWIDLAQQFQSENFWKQIFDEKANPSTPITIANPFSGIQEYIPKADLYQTEGSLFVEIELPGINHDEVQISYQKQQLLTISGQFTSLKPNCKYYLKERANLRFKKELIVPYPVDFEKYRRESINGVLVISMPLIQEETEDIPIHFEE